MKITLEMIKELRTKTGAGVSVVKEALTKYEGDIDKSLIYLREKGLAKAEKRADKSASNGLITSYIHGNGSLGVLLELHSETDFAAKGEKFAELAHEISLQIASSNPEYISVENIPADILKREMDLASKDVDPKKPAQVQQMIIQGKLQKFYEDFVLLEQPFFKDESKKIKDLINDYVAVLGEKIEIGRFCRFKLSGPATSCNI